VIALVFKYLNSITYTVVQITSITVTGLLASALFHDKLSYSFLMGCCMVSVACYMMYRKSLDSSHRYVRVRPALDSPNPWLWS
jgi:drug/metabolite transporter (DMT)-like permease